MQRGVHVQALEPGYVSSLCWYMFVMMTSHSLIGLVQSLFSDSENSEGDPMMMMMGSMGGAANPMMPGGGPDMSKVYKQEQESLDTIQHEFVLDNIEMDLLRKWKQERRARDLGETDTESIADRGAVKRAI